MKWKGLKLSLVPVCFMVKSISINVTASMMGYEKASFKLYLALSGNLVFKIRVLNVAKEDTLCFSAPGKDTHII